MKIFRSGSFKEETDKRDLTECCGTICDKCECDICEGAGYMVDESYVMGRCITCEGSGRKQKG